MIRKNQHKDEIPICNRFQFEYRENSSAFFDQNYFSNQFYDLIHDQRRFQHIDSNKNKNYSIH